MTCAKIFSAEKPENTKKEGTTQKPALSSFLYNQCSSAFTNGEFSRDCL